MELFKDIFGETVDVSVSNVPEIGHKGRAMVICGQQHAIQGLEEDSPSGQHVVPCRPGAVEIPLIFKVARRAAPEHCRRTFGQVTDLVRADVILSATMTKVSVMEQSATLCREIQGKRGLQNKVIFLQRSHHLELRWRPPHDPLPSGLSHHLRYPGLKMRLRPGKVIARR